MANIDTNKLSDYFQKYLINILGLYWAEKIDRDVLDFYLGYKQCYELIFRPLSWNRGWIDFCHMYNIEPEVKSIVQELLFKSNEGSLYYHQGEFISKVLNNTDNFGHIISVPTAMGKTESFLIPVLDYCCKKLKNEENGLFAVFLYPTKSLEADQLNRFIKYIYLINQKGMHLSVGIWDGDTPHYFGRYNIGNNFRGLKCPECNCNIVINEDYQAVCEKESIVFDFIKLTRNEMRKFDPEILITNPEALEYRNTSIYDNFRIEQSLRYLVLDEAHYWAGASTLPISLLLRRIQKKSPSLKVLLSSATLGADKESLTNFCQDLLNSKNFDITDFSPVIPRRLIRLIKEFKRDNYNYLLPEDYFVEKISNYGLTVETIKQLLSESGTGNFRMHILVAPVLEFHYCTTCQKISPRTCIYCNKKTEPLYICKKCHRPYYIADGLFKSIFTDCFDHEGKIALKDLNLVSLLNHIGTMFMLDLPESERKGIIFTRSRMEAETIVNSYIEEIYLNYLPSWVANIFIDKKIRSLQDVRSTLIDYCLKEFLFKPYGEENRDSNLLSGYYLIFHSLTSINSKRIVALFEEDKMIFCDPVVLEDSNQEDSINHFLINALLQHLLSSAKYDLEYKHYTISLNESRFYTILKGKFASLFLNLAIEENDIKNLIDDLLKYEWIIFDDDKYVLNIEKIKVIWKEHHHFCQNCNKGFSIDTGDTCPICGMMTFNNELISSEKINDPVIRIAVHKGGIDPQTRNSIEKTLKSSKPKINLVSSTSTLELGIDIGDLSYLFMLQFPREFASYVQRAGRAGRDVSKQSMIFVFVDGSDSVNQTMIDKFSNGEYFWESGKFYKSDEIDYIKSQVMAELLSKFRDSNRKNYKIIYSGLKLLDLNFDKINTRQLNTIAEYIANLFNILKDQMINHKKALIDIFGREYYEQAYEKFFGNEDEPSELILALIEKLLALQEIFSSTFDIQIPEEEILESKLKELWKKHLSQLTRLLGSIGWFSNYRDIKESALLLRIGKREDQFVIRLYEDKDIVKGAIENYTGSTDYYGGSAFKTVESFCGGRKLATYTCCSNSGCKISFIPFLDRIKRCPICKNHTTEITCGNYVGSILKTKGFLQKTYPVKISL